MRSILFDELNNNEINNINNYLTKNTKNSNIDGLFWLILPNNILTVEQQKINIKHGPYKIAIEIGKSWLKFELLIRTSNITNIGSSIVNNIQLDYIYNFANNLAEQLNLITCK
jgi:hypothetical protein